MQRALRRRAGLFLRGLCITGTEGGKPALVLTEAVCTSALPPSPPPISSWCRTFASHKPATPPDQPVKDSPDPLALFAAQRAAAVDAVHLACLPALSDSWGLVYGNVVCLHEPIYFGSSRIESSIDRLRGTGQVVAKRRAASTRSRHHSPHVDVLRAPPPCLVLPREGVLSGQGMLLGEESSPLWVWNHDGVSRYVGEPALQVRG